MDYSFSCYCPYNTGIFCKFIGRLDARRTQSKITMTNLLEINNLSVDFPSRRGQVSAVNKVSLAVAKGEVLGLVGESGAGKSTIGNSVINLLEPPGHISGGEIIFDGTRIDQMSNEEMRKIRGAKIGTIFQDPQTSLNPLMTIGKQLSETLIETL